MDEQTVMQMEDERPKRRRIRLAASEYAMVGTVVFITLATYERKPGFEDSRFATQCLERLEQQSAQANIAVLAYCFMPDHLHLLLRVDGDTGIVAFLHAFKTRTTRDAWAHQMHGKLWQRSFYDHVARSPDEETRAMRYILENPVRSGLVQSWRDYPFSGSLTYTFDDDSLWDPH